MADGFVNKRVFVTGGSSGIGKETIIELSKRGARLAFCGLEDDLVSKVSLELGVPGVSVDLSKGYGVLEAFDFAIDVLGGIDILINNAGGATAKLIDDLTRKDFEYMFALNAIAPVELVKKALPYFKEQGYGDIVNVGATGASYGFKTGTAYGSSKAALSSISKCLAAELREFGVRVFHVDPSRCDDDSQVNNPDQKLTSSDVAQTIVTVLALNRNAFIPQMSIWASNP